LTFTGRWCLSSATNAFDGDSLYSCGSSGDVYRWTPDIPVTGTYEVYVWVTPHPSRSTAVPVTVAYATGRATRTFKEQAGGGGWVLHGMYTLMAGRAG
jgi:endoglucanase